jgi:hypothetical protein
MRMLALVLLGLSFFLPYASAFSIHGIWVSKVYPGDNGAILVVTNEILSSGMCPEEKAINCTLVPDMISTDIFYVSGNGYYFLGEYPKDPNVTFEGGLWKLSLHTWNGSVKNVTFDPACLKFSSMVPLNFPNFSNLSIRWKKVVLNSFVLEYPRDFLGFYSDSSNNYTVILENMRVKRILSYFPFPIKLNGKFYSLYALKGSTLVQVPLRVNPNLTCIASTSTSSIHIPAKAPKERHICGPGLMVLLALILKLPRRE